jgi:hypothetical protein
MESVHKSKIRNIRKDWETCRQAGARGVKREARGRQGKLEVRFRISDKIAIRMRDFELRMNH